MSFFTYIGMAVCVAFAALLTFVLWVVVEYVTGCAAFVWRIDRALVRANLAESRWKRMRSAFPRFGAFFRAGPQITVTIQGGAFEKLSWPRRRAAEGLEDDGE